MYLANHGAKDGLKCATPIGITLQRLILYTLAYLIVLTLPQISYLCMCASLKPNHFEHTCRGSYHYQVGFYGAYLNLNKGV